MIALAAAMIVAGVALFVAAPLAGGLLPFRRPSTAELDQKRLEHDRALAVQGLRELEFDRAMGKLSDADYAQLKVTLENRALSAMKSLQALELGTKPRAEAPRAEVPKVQIAAASAPRAHLRFESPVRRAEGSRPAPAAPAVITPHLSPMSRNIAYCPQCGTRTINDARFCAECGVALRPLGRATGWND